MSTPICRVLKAFNGSGAVKGPWTVCTALPDFFLQHIKSITISHVQSMLHRSCAGSGSLDVGCMKQAQVSVLISPGPVDFKSEAKVQDQDVPGQYTKNTFDAHRVTSTIWPLLSSSSHMLLWLPVT